MKLRILFTALLLAGASALHKTMPEFGYWPWLAAFAGTAGLWYSEAKKGWAAMAAATTVCLLLLPTHAFAATGDAVDKVANKVVDILGAAQDAIAQYAPDAFKLAVEAMFYSGLAQFILAMILLVAAAVVTRACVVLFNAGFRVMRENVEYFNSQKLLRKAANLYDGDLKHSESEIPRFVFGGIGVAVAALLWIFTMVQVADTNMWLKLVSPKSAIVLKVLDQVSKK